MYCKPAFHLNDTGVVITMSPMTKNADESVGKRASDARQRTDQQVHQFGEKRTDGRTMAKDNVGRKNELNAHSF